MILGERFFKLSNAMFCYHLTPIQFTVYSFLVSSAGQKLKCWPSVKTIAANCACSANAARAAIDVLERRGFIRRVARYQDRTNGSVRQTSNAYFILDPPPLPISRDVGVYEQDEREQGQASFAAALSEIAMGVSYDGPVITDLNKMPHWLMGGATGSGKTTLLVVFVQQCLMKVTATGEQAVDVYIIDLKGGQDYPPHWRNRDCSFCVTAEDALSVLGGLVTALKRRLKLFSDASERFGVPCSTLDDYNRLCSDAPLRRNVIVIDELAEITDTTGMDKPHKELAAAVVGKLATIARLGRSVGFNLVIGVQRGDANIVPGQIKSNISGRVCGVADDVLSQIVLGNTEADKLPKHGRGLFLNQDGVMFRGYLPMEAPRPKAPNNKEGGTNEHPNP